MEVELPKNLPACLTVNDLGQFWMDTPCAQCGYNLRGMSLRDQCPRCDLAAFQSAAPIHIPTDEHNRLAADAPCQRCAYNLRMQPTNGRCPECGLPVVQSTLFHFLCIADPGWIGQLCQGVNLVIASIAMLLVNTFLSHALYDNNITTSTEHFWAAFFRCIVFVPALIGIWLISRPDPTLDIESEDTRVRRLLGVAVIGVAIAVASGIDIALVRMGGARSPDPSWVTIGLVMGGCTGVLVLGIACRHLRALAERIPNQKLATMLAKLYKGWLWVFGLGVLPLPFVWMISSLAVRSVVNDVYGYGLTLLTGLMILWSLIVLSLTSVATHKTIAQAEDNAAFSAIRTYVAPRRSMRAGMR